MPIIKAVQGGIGFGSLCSTSIAQFTTLTLPLALKKIKGLSFFLAYFSKYPGIVIHSLLWVLSLKWPWKQSYRSPAQPLITIAAYVKSTWINRLEDNVISERQMTCKFRCKSLFTYSCQGIVFSVFHYGCGAEVTQMNLEIYSHQSEFKNFIFNNEYLLLFMREVVSQSCLIGIQKRWW